MEKITKKTFLELHKNKKLKLIASILINKEKMFQKINEFIENKGINALKENLIDLSRIDLNSLDTCYDHEDYIFVESVYNNSINTIAYYKI